MAKRTDKLTEEQALRDTARIWRIRAMRREFCAGKIPEVKSYMHDCPCCEYTYQRIPVSILTARGIDMLDEDPSFSDLADQCARYCPMWPAWGGRQCFKKGTSPYFAFLNTCRSDLKQAAKRALEISNAAYNLLAELQVRQSTIVTSPVDYTGCHPQIAEALSSGKTIECIVWNIDDRGRKVEVINYLAEEGWYIGLDKSMDPASLYINKSAEPVRVPNCVKLRVKPRKEFVETLVQEGYQNIAPDHWTPSKAQDGATHRVSVIPDMFSRCGKEYDISVEDIADNWIELSGGYTFRRSWFVDK